MERYRIDCEGSPASTETYWIYDNAQGRAVCHCERLTDADHIAALLNADAARQNGDDLPACPVCHGSGCRLKGDEDIPELRTRVRQQEAEIQKLRHVIEWHQDEIRSYQATIEVLEDDETREALKQASEEEGETVPWERVKCKLESPPWPEVPKDIPQVIMSQSVYLMRPAVNALIACVADLQRRLGKEA